MQKLKHAVENAGVKYIKIKSIKFIGNEDVYNMEVKNVHNFSINNGLIVHNCIDALRYALHKHITATRKVIKFSENTIRQLESAIY